MRLFPYLFLLTLSALMGCQSAPRVMPCESSDWFELGRQMGTAGRVSGAPEQRQRCPVEFTKVSEALYHNGYNYGLADYCTPEVGFETGRLGKPLLKVCPRPTNLEFEKFYAKGQKVRDIEQANIALDRKISSISGKIKKSKLNRSQKTELDTELSTLAQAKSENQKRLKELQD